MGPRSGLRQRLRLRLRSELRLRLRLGLELRPRLRYMPASRYRVGYMHAAAIAVQKLNALGPRRSTNLIRKCTGRESVDRIEADQRDHAVRPRGTDSPSPRLGAPTRLRGTDSPAVRPRGTDSLAVRPRGTEFGGGSGEEHGGKVTCTANLRSMRT